MRIVRLANFVTTHSGGLRTALRKLGEGYQRAGHEAVLVVPGREPSDTMTSQGRVITLASAPLPRSGGFRVLAGRRQLTRLLERLEPDRIEVSDRSTLRWTGRWAADRGVGSMMVSHESLAGLLGLWGMPRRDSLADRLNLRTARAFDTIVCTTAFAAAEFRRLGVPNLVEVPLGVDLDEFHPSRADPAVRARYARPDELLMVFCSRLSAVKRPELAIDAVAALRNDRVPAVLVVTGDGTRRNALAYRAARLPVRFTGHIADREAVATLLASADVVVAPGPVETFGLAALEALACGTPVVVNRESALPEVVGAAGAAVAGTGEALAAGVRDLMARPESERRLAARRQAEGFGWQQAVDGFLRAHGAAPHPAAGPQAVPGAQPVAGQQAVPGSHAVAGPQAVPGSHPAGGPHAVPAPVGRQRLRPAVPGLSTAAVYPQGRGAAAEPSA
jgi:alpha-1,6-mannosyltransferase